MNIRPAATATALALGLTTFAVSVPSLTPMAFAKVQTQVEDNRFVKSARNHYEAGRTREAVIELKNALREDSNDVAARLLLGRIMLKQNDQAGAETELKRAYDLNPTDEIASLYGEALLQRGAHEEAMKVVSGQGASVDGNVSRLVVRGDALVGLKRLDEAEQTFQQLLQLDPRRVEGHFGLAQVYTARKDYRAASEKLDEIVIGKPDFSPGWMLRGEVALVKGNLQAAFVAFDTAVDLAPDSVPALVARARAHLSSGDLDRAVADTNAVARLSPQAPITYYLRAATAFARGDIEKANNAFTHLQRNFDQFPPAILLGALIKNQKGDQNQADALLTRYLAMQPDNMDAHRALASVRLKSGQPSSAVDILKGILRKAPNDLVSLRQLASAYLALDDYNKASEIFRTISESGSANAAREADMALSLLSDSTEGVEPALQDPQVRKTLLKAIDNVSSGNIEGAQALLNTIDVTSATIYSMKGNIAGELGKTDEARELLTKALSMEPELVSALNAFERLDQREGTTDRILPRLRGLLEKNPQSERLTLSIAQHLDREGDRDAAIDFLNKRTKVVPNSATINRSLVAALMVQKRLSEAANAADHLASISTNDPGMQVYAVNVLIDANEAGRAVPIAKNIVSMVGDSPRAYTLLSEAQVKSGDIIGARETLTTASKKWSDDVGIASAIVRLESARNNPAGVREATDMLARTDKNAAARLRANALAEMGQPILAVTVLEKAFAASPDQRIAVDLFALRRRAGRDADAFADLGAWVDQHPEDRGALMAYATGLLETGQEEKASKAYAAFLSLEPNNPVALNNYAWLRHKAKRPDALDYAQRAYESARNSPEIADTYGWMLVNSGKLKEGLALLKSAQAAAPNNKAIRFHFAYALSMAGRKDEAKTMLVQVLSDAVQFEERAEAEALMKQLNEG